MKKIYKLAKELTEILQEANYFLELIQTDSIESEDFVKANYFEVDRIIVEIHFSEIFIIFDLIDGCHVVQFSKYIEDYLIDYSKNEDYLKVKTYTKNENSLEDILFELSELDNDILLYQRVQRLNFIQTL